MPDQVLSTVYPLLESFSSQEVAAADVREVVADCHNEQLTGVLGKFETVRRRRFVIPKCILLSGFALNDGTVERLLGVLVEDVLDYRWQVNASMWADILLALDSNRSHRLRNGLQVIYCSYNNGPDWLHVHGLAEDSERFVYDQYDLEIPDSQRGEVWAMLGIHSGERHTPRIIATGSPGTYRAPE